MAMTVEQYIESMTNDARFSNKVVKVVEFPQREAVYRDLDFPLCEPLNDYLRNKGFRLYSHQCDTIEHARDGSNIVITTPTASGKTLSFNLPVFERLHLEPEATALYLYPLKALENDQLKAIRELERETGIDLKAAKYDRDTPKEERPKIREETRLCLTNPHLWNNVLSWHRQWARFYRNLRFIVIDEAHTYRGAFGTHVAYLIRRILRICKHYGSSPQVIMATATIANPLEFAHEITGCDFELVCENGAPTGKKTLVMYNPNRAVIEINGDTNSKSNLNRGIIGMFLDSILSGMQTICFARSRKQAEILSKSVREHIAHLRAKRLIDGGEPFDLTENMISPYRSGYTPEERASIENRLKSGEIRGVITTNALEVGIDIGGLDSVIICGYPSTMMSLWQQIGRAGRRNTESVAVFVANTSVVDQYFMQHPDVFLNKPVEHAVIDLTNKHIARQHIESSAYEVPLTVGDMGYFGEVYVDVVSDLIDSDKLNPVRSGKITPRGKDSPAYYINMSAISSDVFTVFNNNRKIEQMIPSMAYRELHQDAVYYHNGKTFIVDTFDTPGRMVTVVDGSYVRYTTNPVSKTTVDVKEIEKKKVDCGVSVYYGVVDVTVDYVSYIKRDLGHTEPSGMFPLYDHTYTYETKAMWFDIPTKVIEADFMTFLRGIEGFENTMSGIIPLNIMCDRNDIGTSCDVNSANDKGTLYIFDAAEGGIGLAEKAYEIIMEIIENAVNVLETCTCAKGCPMCIMSGKVTPNSTLDKEMSIMLGKTVSDHIKKFR